MKAKIKLNDIFSLKTKKGSQIIFDIKLLEGNLLIGNIFKDDESNIRFRIIGVGLENKKYDKNSIRILVEILDNTKIEFFKNQTFSLIE